MKQSVSFIIVALIGLTVSSLAADAAEQTDKVLLCIPTLRTDNRTLDTAFRIALGDFVGNIALFQDGLLDQPQPVILAGLDYGRPWTRDASINAWIGGSITGNGTLLRHCTVNGQATKTPFVDAETVGPVTIVMQMGEH